MGKIYRKFKEIDVSKGEELYGMAGVSGELPDTIKVIDQYDDWLLVEMTFTKSDWGMIGERKLRRGIPKGAMLCGDVRLERYDGSLLIGEEIGEWEYLKEEGDVEYDLAYATAG